MQYLIGVDAGGTKTQARCVDETGVIVGEGLSGPASLTVMSAGAASFNVREAIRQAIEPATSSGNEMVISRVAMGLAGMDTPPEEEMAKQVFGQVLAQFNIQDFVLVNDIVIALESGTTAADAIALISGTGSNCFGRNAAGLTAKTGGMDSLLTDQGSGYAIGRGVLRRVVKSFDGRAPRTILEELVCQHFRITTIAELKPKVTTPPLNKTEIAELAQVCLRGFDQGDQVARHILDDAIDELVLMATTVLTKLDLLGKATDCVLAGSITKIAYIQEQLKIRLSEKCPQLRVIIPDQPPVSGAVKLAQLGYVAHAV